MNGSTARIGLISLMLCLGLSTPSAWGEIRSISTGGLTTTALGASEGVSVYAYSANQTLLVDIPHFTLIFQAEGEIKPALNYQVLCGLGLSHSWTPEWYSSLTYSGMWMEGSGYWHRFDAESAYEGPVWRFTLHERLQANGEAFSAITSLGTYWAMLNWWSWYDALILGWDGAHAPTFGTWAYAEFTPLALQLRLGGAIGSYYDESYLIKQGLDASVYARVGLKLSAKNVVALDGQWFLGTMTANRLGFSLVADFRW